MRKGKIFTGKVRWVLSMPCGELIGFRNKPKKIAGGYIDQYGKRYIRDERRSFNTIRLIPNLYQCL